MARAVPVLCGPDFPLSASEPGVTRRNETDDDSTYIGTTCRATLPMRERRIVSPIEGGVLPVVGGVLDDGVEGKPSLCHDQRWLIPMTEVIVVDCMGWSHPHHSPGNGNSQRRNDHTESLHLSLSLDNRRAVYPPEPYASAAQSGGLAADYVDIHLNRGHPISEILPQLNV